MRQAALLRTPARTASTGVARRRARGSRSPATCWQGPAVIAETAKAYAANAALPFPRRLIAALKAGEAAGGDKRGKQSAALLIYGEEEWPDLDIRVDDHADPLAELERLEAVSRERWVHFAKLLPSKRDPGRHHRPRGARCAHRRRAGRGEVMSAPLLAIENLRVVFHGDRGRRTVAVDGVDLSLARGSTLGLVGESGCGKSVTSLAVMGLLPKATRRSVGRRDLRWRRVARLAGSRIARSARRPPRDDLPGADDLAQSELHHRRPDHRGAGAPPRPLRGAGARQGDRAARSAPAFRRPSSASTTIRTSFPAACASAS